MWTYPGSSCPDYPSPKELSAVEVKDRIHKVLDFTATPSPGTLPRPVSVTFVILHFHCACDLAQGLRCGGGESQGVDPPTDASRWEVSNASMAPRGRVRRGREIGVLPIGQ
jgi:hypothetical protein